MPPDSFTETELEGVLTEDTDDDDLTATIAAALKADAEPEEDAPTESEAAPEGDPKSDDEADKPDTEEHAEEGASSTDKEDVAASDVKAGDDKLSDTKDTRTEQAKEPVIEPPAMFTEADKETFRALPTEAQDIVARREKERNEDYDRKSQDIAEQRKAVDAFQAAVQPYQPYFASLGTTPEQAFHVLLATEYQLRTGAPDQKLKVFTQLAKTYGIDPADLSDLSEADPVSPEIARFDQRLTGLEHRTNADAREAAGQLQGNAQSQIAAFAGEKDADGNPAHPHLEAVATIMGREMQAASDRNEDLDMTTAYVNATYANPIIRTQVLAKQREIAEQEATAKRVEAQRKEDQVRAKKAKEAKKASVSIKATSEPSGKAADEELDLRAQIEKEYERASASQ